MCMRERRHVIERAETRDQLKCFCLGRGDDVEVSTL